MAQIHMPRWAKPLTQEATYKSISGGRNSTKTWTVAHMLAAEGYEKPIRVACLREFQESIEESVKQALDIAIERLGLTDFYNSTKYNIDAPNGTCFRFRGMERSKESLKGLESFTRVWVEQAERLSYTSAELMIPTFTRVPGVQFYFTWNPNQRTDWVWQRFKVNPREGDVSLHVTYRDNPWVSREADDERRAHLIENPAAYEHHWEGKPNDQGADLKVLPYPMLAACVEAWKLHADKFTGGRRELGLDVADSGEDYNVAVIRRGPILEHVDRWRSLIIADTSRRCDRMAEDWEVDRVNYDAGGVGAGVRSDFAQMTNRRYAIRPELFGASIKGPETTYSYRLKNKDFFRLRNGQLGWALRLRAQATERLMAGEDIPLERCLFINPGIPLLDDLLAQMAQPEWKENPQTGKLELEKRDANERSPDLYDGCVLAFASDSDHGLRSR